jgi:hypothetical protein
MTILVAFIAIIAIAIPAAAITRGGELDGDDHPTVGLMVADDADGNPMWRCSGALVSETLFVTAGHCTFGAAGATIWFDSDVESGIPANGYPFNGDVDGTPFTHPMYMDGAFWAYDVGVVVLDTPQPGPYYDLPYLGQIDDYIGEAGNGRKGAFVEAVGYGLQDIKPVTIADRIRMKANLMIVNTTGVAGLGHLTPGQQIVVSGDAKHGGTCFGDSGGPMFLGGENVIGAVNSFGLNSNCAGIGGAYRLDQPDDIEFLSNYYDYGG